jgi:hypothetical protein
MPVDEQKLIERFDKRLCLHCGKRPILMCGVCREDYLTLAEPGAYAGMFKGIRAAKLAAMTPIERALYWLAESVRDGHLEMEAGYPYANPLNDRTRKLIAAVREQLGAAWLFKLDQDSWDRPDRPLLREWDGVEIVRNFDASAVVPAYDTELVKLVEDYRAAKLPELDAKIELVFARVRALGGHALEWN